MISRRIQGANQQLGAPKDWRKDDPTITALHVRVTQLTETVQVYASAWEPTPAELAALNRGGSIILNIVGGQPPISLHVEDPATAEEIAR